ncbi:hypothetical protein PybrP1_004578 [[Pythium] brassicae (nom. inval.)]|nr:hypothetical protein PybrP1_004578 [[Pythium] brassicae (nom. inval.)]
MPSDRSAVDNTGDWSCAPSAPTDSKWPEDERDESTLAAQMRKSRSTAEKYRGVLRDDSEDHGALGARESRRPYTAATSSPTRFHASASARKKKAPAKRCATAEIHNNPAEDFPPTPPWTADSARFKASREQPRPATHVLRQRPLAVVDFDSAQPRENKTSTRSSRLNGPRRRIQPPTGSGPPPTPPSLQPPRLPQLTHTRLSSSDSLAAAPLFGPSIPDTHETRACVFERFRALWGLMSSRSSSACVASAASASPPKAASAAVESKSPFECSMALIKVCKSVGTSRGSSSSPAAVAFWSSRDRDVDFQSFCSDVVRLAIAPALHHFKADASVDEFVAAVDRILQNLVTCTSTAAVGAGAAAAASSLSLKAVVDTGADGAEAPRLKELVEIRPLFPRWEAGASPLEKLNAGANSSHPEAASSPASTDAQREGAAPRARLAAPAFPSRREVTLQLPTSEARATHDENIRRKVQLHKSWRTRSVLLAATAAAAAPQAVRDSAVVGTPPAGSHSPLRTNAARGVLDRMSVVVAAAADDASRPGCEASAAAAAYERTRVHVAPPAAAESAGNDASLAAVYEDVLVCGACAVADAALWCASCFRVFCVACWQQQHRLQVDASVVRSPSLLSVGPLLAPATKHLTKPQQPGASDSSTSPPFAMIYLPMKPLAVGKLAKGAACKPSACDDRPPDTANELPVVAAHALLPPLLLVPPTEPPAVRASEHFESTSNLLKALMLGSAPHAAASTKKALMPVLRMHTEPARRGKLRVAPVLLDGAQLAQSDGRRC